LIGGTYAWFTLTLKGTKVNVLKAGSLSLILNDENSIGISKDKAVPMLDEVGEKENAYHFTLENHSTIPSEYILYLDDLDLEENETRMDDSFVKYQLIKDGEKNTALLNTTGTHPNRILDTGTINGNTTITYDLRLWIDENTGNEAMGQVVRTKIRVLATQTKEIGETPKGENPNILNVYSYDVAACLTGEEETCVERTERPSTYEAGTIIKYKVNDTEEKYFHVIEDKGNELILQQRENLINQTAWYANENNNKVGPLTALQTLESATADWTNVKDQAYTMGTTTFKENAYTGCSLTECTVNKYTLEERTAKARMITAQEAIALGCTNDNQSCPVWMNNYLKDATYYGGTEVGTDYRYWTMSANSSESRYNTYAITVTCNGNITDNKSTTDTTAGIRPVVVIDK